MTFRRPRQAPREVRSAAGPPTDQRPSIGLLLLGRHPGEPLQVAPPSPTLADAVVNRLAAAEPVEEPVLQLHEGPLWPVRGEPHLDLAGVRGIRVVLPLAVDLPGDHQSVRRLPPHATAP